MFHFLVSGVALARIAVEFRVDLAERPLQEFDIALQAPVRRSLCFSAVQASRP